MNLIPSKNKGFMNTPILGAQNSMYLTPYLLNKANQQKGLFKFVQFCSSFYFESNLLKFQYWIFKKDNWTFFIKKDKTNSSKF
jgi:hypothetical protein